MTLELYEKQLVRSILDLVTHNRDFAVDFFNSENILEDRVELRKNLLPIKEFVLEHRNDDEDKYKKELKIFVSHNITDADIKTIFNNSLSIEE
ncbi:hypothetical protein GNP81_08675 [Aliivibrio fischeri]|uniref:hypothetical protein n=1 Tax=Aliivibrio fischeri TaxID=668 RepID=UPI0012D8B494|nr:hypothetical protein [Aliivibrio fischeri]MUK60587.1 hypothetical protein [Aliivibrio fischeri]MUL19736.1 hypothetical protein [Aliivibrio fischeri]MUL24682.1 hypothetical protein [Aliivibrio fischeri]